MNAEKRLDRITFTGIDQFTKKNDLVKLSQEFPNIEFGFLHAKTWRDQTNRYPSPLEMKRLYEQGINFSLHLCGEFAGKALVSDFTDVYKNLGQSLLNFQRIQLNVVGKSAKQRYHLVSPTETLQAFIIQVSNVEKMEMLEHLEGNSNIFCTPLFDVSGGRGKSVERSEEDFLFEQNYYGIAGGINPSNCVSIVEDILVKDFEGRDFWIDMETGVRDDRDKFSTEACYQVCKQLRSYLK